MNLDVSEDESTVDHFDTMNETPIGELRRRGVKPGFKRGKYQYNAFWAKNERARE